MPSNTDYILGGTGVIAQGVGSLLDQQKAAQAQQRGVHPSIQRYMQAVLAGQMSPFEAATRAKLDMQAGTPGTPSGVPPVASPAPQAPQGLQVPAQAQAPQSLLSPQPPASAPQVQTSPTSRSSLLAASGPDRPFTAQDMADFHQLAPFYQSQQALQRAAETRASVEAEASKTRAQRQNLTEARLGLLERMANASTAQRERASELAFQARMAAIKAMERVSRSRSAMTKDILTFQEEGRNLRAERANIARELAAVAQSFGDESQTKAVMDDAQRRLKELSQLESAYEPIRQLMLHRSGLSEDEFERKFFGPNEDLLAPLTESESETQTRSTPAGMR